MTAGWKCSCDNGKVRGIGCGPTVGSRIVELPCSRCEGSGWIDPARDEVLRAADKLSARRERLNLSKREAANLLGMKAVDYSDLEFARKGATAKQIHDTIAQLVQRHKEASR